MISANGAIAGTPDGSLVDATAFNPAWSGAAGEMTSTVQDLLAYGRPLGTGAGLLTPAAQLTRLASFRPAFSDTAQYGQGLVCRGGWVGHGGDTLGYHTDLYHSGAIDTTIAVLMNRYPSYQPQNVVSAIATTLDQPIAAME